MLFLSDNSCLFNFLTRFNEEIIIISNKAFKPLKRGPNALKSPLQFLFTLLTRDQALLVKECSLVLPVLYARLRVDEFEVADLIRILNQVLEEMRENRLRKDVVTR